MCDKHSFRDTKDLIDKMNTRERNMVTPPKSAYELLMLSKQKGITMWFTGDRCDSCHMVVYTDGRLFWCKKGCENDGKRGKNDPDRMGFITDYF